MVTVVMAKWPSCLPATLVNTVQCVQLVAGTVSVMHFQKKKKKENHGFIRTSGTKIFCYTRAWNDYLEFYTSQVYSQMVKDERYRHTQQELVLVFSSPGLPILVDVLFSPCYCCPCRLRCAREPPLFDLTLHVQEWVNQERPRSTVIILQECP